MKELRSVEQLSIETKVEATSEEAYLSPRLVYLGDAKEIISGAYSSGYTDSSHDWYSTGE
jgi:hypothetical protein